MKTSWIWRQSIPDDPDGDSLFLERGTVYPLSSCVLPVLSAWRKVGAQLTLDE